MVTKAIIRNPGGRGKQNEVCILDWMGLLYKHSVGVINIDRNKFETTKSIPHYVPSLTSKFWGMHARM
jgi:hypothetical protein